MRCVICSKRFVPTYELFELDLVAVAERAGTEELGCDIRGDCASGSANSTSIS
jgi:hypothetical protein